ncbi:MAG: RNA polymerase sigma factor, partial [Clostridium sp.]|nr:RNA polymerase sigma factor [Clostridium sp.]
MNKLISKVKNKEQFAITKLYNDNINKIYFICKELVQNEEVALDLSQDIFMTIINKIDTLNDYNKYYAWQKAIAINKCKDYLKRNKELLFIDEEQEELLMQVEETDDTYVPHKYIIKKETRNMIMDIINTKLSDKQRIAVLLFYYNDMKCSEIAEYFECAEGTVKSRLNSARKIIKMEIEKLQEKGVKVRSNAILPLLAFLLEEEARDNKLSKVVKNELLSNILNGTLTSVTKMCMGGLISTKVMAIIAIGTTLVVGGGAAVYKNYLSNNEAKVISQNDVIQENDKTIVDETDKIEDDLEQKEEKKVDTNKNEETVVIDGKEVKIYEEVERDIKSNTNNQEKP